MAVKRETVTPQKMLELAQVLSPADLRWLVEQLNQLLAGESLPESAALEEAIELYLADKCSLVQNLCPTFTLSSSPSQILSC